MAQKLRILGPSVIAKIASAPLLDAIDGWLAPQLVTLSAAIMLVLLPDAPEIDIRRSLDILKLSAPVVLLPAARMPL